MSKSPKYLKEPTVTKTPQIGFTPNYKEMHPVWQIGLLDIEGKWGYKAFDEIISFNISDFLQNYIIGNNLYKLSDILDNLKGKDELTLKSFFTQLSSLPAEDFPPKVLHLISNDIKHQFFLTKLFPKLKEFEKLTWKEIESQTHGPQNKSKNHPINISQLNKEAQDRLKELKQDDVDELYSLRLEGQLRIFGIRELNCLKILWIDIKHEICPSHKKHT